ncbi:site-specific integrase, partial [Vibrio parahaemolyticus]|nr:site-specific integrase [Vibrio parahaemolyticus]
MKISLIDRKLKDGSINLAIEYYKGSEVTLEGKRKHIREYENLKLYLHGVPKNASEKKENKETLLLA